MKIKILLGLIVVLAAFLRFIALGTNPPSLTWDETAWGYNAYSMGIDGKDEFGKTPITYLESFGDYKPPVYAYLDVIPVKLFGLNEFATRFPSALFGTLTVLLTYFLVLKLFPENKESDSHDKSSKSDRSAFLFHDSAFTKSKIIALLSAFILAISPWHIMLSRAAFEANVSTFFLVFGVYLFLSVDKKRQWLLFCSFMSFLIAMNTFNTARIVAPILAAGLVIARYKFLWSIKKGTIISVVVAFIFSIPLLLFLLTPQSKIRFQEVNIFSDVNVIKTLNQEVANDHNALWSKIIHNRRFAYSVDFLQHYFDNLSPSFLFIKGDGNPKFSIQDVGQMYLWEIPTLILGILFLFRKREGYWWLIPFWLIIGIIPAATARETPHALRIEATLPTFQILSAYGLYEILAKVSSLKSQFSKINLRPIIYGLLAIIIFINFAYFLENYMYHYPRNYSGEWQYGYKQAISYIASVQNNYSSVHFTDELGRPYVYFLFYLQYNPSQFWANADVHRDAFGFVTVNSFDKYYFGSIDETKLEPNTLYVDTAAHIKNNVHVVKTFPLLDGEPNLVAFTK